AELAAPAPAGGAEDGLQDLGAAGAEQPADAEDLPGMQLEGDPRDDLAPAAPAARHLQREVAHREDDGAPGRVAGDRLEGELAADHGGDQALAAEPGNRGGED